MHEPGSTRAHPRARIELIPRARHLANFEAPDAFTDAVRRLARELAVGDRPRVPGQAVSPAPPLGCGRRRPADRDYFNCTASPVETTRAVVVVPGKNHRQLPAEVAVTLVLSLPELSVFTVLTVL